MQPKQSHLRPAETGGAVREQEQNDIAFASCKQIIARVWNDDQSCHVRFLLQVQSSITGYALSLSNDARIAVGRMVGRCQSRRTTFERDTYSIS